MKEYLILIYSNYLYYFFVISGILGSYMMIYVLKRKKMVNPTIFFQSLEVFICIAFDFVVAVYLKHHSFNTIQGVSAPFFSAFVLNCIVSCMVGSVSAFIINFIICFFSNTVKIKRETKNAAGVATFVYLMLQLIIYIPNSLNEYGSLWYATDYSMGIGSRFFMGTILKLFYKDYLEAKVVYNFCLVFTIIVIILVSIFANALVNKCNTQIKPALVFIWMLFLVSPGSVVGFWQGENFGRLEFWGFFVGLICIFIYSKVGMNVLSCVLITILSCVSIAIYQGNIFMYYAFVLMIFMWEIIKAKGKRRVIAGIFGAFNILATSVSFVFFQFFGYTKFDNAWDMAVYLSSRTNLGISCAAIDLELFQPISEAYYQFNVPFFGGSELAREHALITVCLLSPIIVLFIGLYKKCIEVRKKNNNRMFQSPYIYFIFVLIIIIPQFILNVDWGRWMVSENILLFGGFLFLVWKEDLGAVEACKALSNWLYCHKLLSIAVLLFVAGLSKFQGRTFIYQSNEIINWLVSNKWLIVQ